MSEHVWRGYTTSDGRVYRRCEVCSQRFPDVLSYGPIEADTPESPPACAPPGPPPRVDPPTPPRGGVVYPRNPGHDTPPGPPPWVETPEQ